MLYVYVNKLKRSNNLQKRIFRTGIGQDSHKFFSEKTSKPCVLGGVVFEDSIGMEANSDGDVVYHAICNAISSVTTVPILGGIAHELFVKDGITDSEVYLKEAIRTLKNKKISHVAISIEAKRPRFQNKINDMRKQIAKVMDLKEDQIGITATSGDGLTNVGLGEGITCFCTISVCEDQ